MPVLTLEHLRALVQTTLELAGLSPDEASVCADAAAFADARGTDTHGIVYILPKTLQTLRDGRAIPGSEPVVKHETASTALLVGSCVAGPVLGQRAMHLAMQK